MALSDIYNSMGISTEEYTPPTAVELTTEELNDYMDTELSKIDTTLSDVNMAFTALSNMTLSTEDSVPPEIAEVTLQAHAVAAGYPAHISAEEGKIKKVGNAILNAIKRAIEYVSDIFTRITHWFKSKLGIYKKTIAKLREDVKALKDKKAPAADATFKIKYPDNMYILAAQKDAPAVDSAEFVGYYSDRLLAASVEGAQHLESIAKAYVDLLKNPKKYGQGDSVYLSQAIIAAASWNGDIISIKDVYIVAIGNTTAVTYVEDVSTVPIKDIPDVQPIIEKVSSNEVDSKILTGEQIGQLIDNAERAIKEYDKISLKTKAIISIGNKILTTFTTIKAAAKGVLDRESIKLIRSSSKIISASGRVLQVLPTIASVDIKTAKTAIAQYG